MYDNRGNAALMLGRRAAAVADLREALRLEKGFAQARRFWSGWRLKSRRRKARQGGSGAVRKVPPAGTRGMDGGDEGRQEGREGERKDGEGAISRPKCCTACCTAFA